MHNIRNILLSIFILAGIFPSAASVQADIQKGDTGKDVMYLQRMLFDTGFLFDEADGIFGSLTEQAVKDYQEFALLPVTGIVDDYTWSALGTTWCQFIDEMYGDDACLQLFLDNFPGEFVEYGSEVFGDGTFTDAYVYESMVGVTFARLAFGAEASEVGMVIAQRAGIDPEDMVRTEEESLDGYPAYRLEYTIGSNEDTRHSIDKVFVDEAESVIHWFHCAIPVDWYEDYKDITEEWIDNLYFDFGYKESPLGIRSITENANPPAN